MKEARKALMRDLRTLMAMPEFRRVAWRFLEGRRQELSLVEPFVLAQVGVHNYCKVYEEEIKEADLAAYLTMVREHTKGAQDA